MKYYEVKKECDNFQKPGGDIYIGGELYTEREVKKGNLNTKFMNIVHYRKSQSYYFFGARFNLDQ